MSDGLDAKAVVRALPGVWREAGGLGGLVRLDVHALTPGMVVVAKVSEPWQARPELRWQVWPDLLEPTDVVARASLAGGRPHEVGGASGAWSAPTTLDGHRRCNFCGAFVRDNGDLGEHECRSNP